MTALDLHPWHRRTIENLHAEVMAAKGSTGGRHKALVRMAARLGELSRWPGLHIEEARAACIEAAEACGKMHDDPRSALRGIEDGLARGQGNTKAVPPPGDVLAAVGMARSGRAPARREAPRAQRTAQAPRVKPPPTPAELAARWERLRQPRSHRGDAADEALERWITEHLAPSRRGLEALAAFIAERNPTEAELDAWMVEHGRRHAGESPARTWPHFGADWPSFLECYDLVRLGERGPGVRAWTLEGELAALLPLGASLPSGLVLAPRGEWLLPGDDEMAWLLCGPDEWLGACGWAVREGEDVLNVVGLADPAVLRGRWTPADLYVGPGLPPGVADMIGRAVARVELT